MRAIQKNDYVFAVDIAKTIDYYKTHSLCECDYCRNYYTQIKGIFPELEAFLSEFGIDISKPDEINMSFKVDHEIHYIAVDYTVCGNIEHMGQNEIEISGNHIFRIVITDGFASPNEQTSDYFTISLNNKFALPWALDEPFPKVAKTNLREKIGRLFQKLFKT